jgi:hypothetical protein
MRINFRRIRRGLWISGLALLFLGSAGCSSSGTVSGKVKMKDQTLDRGTITFTSLDKQWVRTSAIGEDGSYTISKAPPGPMKISIVSTGPTQQFQAKAKKKMPTTQGEKDEDLPTRARMMHMQGASRPSGPSVPKKYNDPETSGLTYEVKPGNQEHNIELK